jgi:hypothetical protein
VTDYVVPSGARVAFDWGSAYTAPAGGSLAFELLQPVTLYLAPDGFGGAFGTATLANEDQGALPHGFSQFATGRATVQNKNRTVSMWTGSGVVPGEVSALATVVRQAIIAPAGITTSTVLKPSEVSTTFYRPRAGNIININFAGAAYTQPAGNAITLEFTLGGGLFREITPAGLLSQAFGTVAIIGGTQHVTAPSIGNLLHFGNATVQLGLHYVLPSGFTQAAFGTASLYNTTQFVRPTGFEQTRFGFPLDGTGSIDFLDRTIRPSGFIDDAFGTALAAGGLRFVDQSGHGVAPPGFGTDFVAFRERRLEPRGNTHTTYGNATIGFNQIVTLTGWEELAWGLNAVHDNSQHPTISGFVATVFGLPFVAPNPQPARPLGIFDGDVFPYGQLGLAAIRNLTQIAHQTFDDQNTDYLEGFGSPVHMTVENVDRAMRTVGSNMAVVSNATTVENKAYPIRPASWDSGTLGFDHDGHGFIAYAIRSIVAPGPLDPILGYITPFHAVERTPEIDAPSIAQGAFGVSSLVNTRRTFAIPSAGDMSVWGVPRVEYLIRTLLPDGIDAYGFGIPGVELGTRYLAPSGIDLVNMQFGRTSVEEHFNRIFTHGQQYTVVGLEHYVRNVTPELHPYWSDSTEWGHNALHNQWTAYAMQGFAQWAFGRTVVADRAQTVAVHGASDERVSTFAQVYNDTPDPPAARIVAPQGIARPDTFWGRPTVTWNSIFPTLEVMTLWGRPTVRANSIRPDGFGTNLLDDGQFGHARLNATQHIALTDKGMPGAYGEGDTHKPARIDPFTIYCSFALPDRYVEGLLEAREWKLIDGFEGDNGQRPFWGAHAVSNQIRAIFPFHRLAGEGDATVGEKFGGLHIDLGNRVVRATGIKSLRAGFPVVTHGGEITLDGFHYGIDASAEFGDATISQDEGTRRVLGASAGGPEQWGSNRAELFNRALTLTGWDSARYGSAPAPYVTPPNFRYMEGFIATVWGTQRVEHRIRTLTTQGALDETFVPDVDEFTTRMLVGRQITLQLPGIAPGSIGAASVWRAQRGVSGVTMMDTAVISHGASVRFQNIVELGGYGWLDEGFGDVWRAESGTIKCRGWSAESLGNNGQLARTLPANGFLAGAFGDNVVGQVAYPVGLDAHAFGATVLTHTDGLEFTCGTLARAIVAQAISQSAFGVPEFSSGYIHPLGWLDETFGATHVTSPHTISASGWLDETFGTLRLDYALFLSGWLDEAFGTAKSVMSVVGSGFEGDSYGVPRFDRTLPTDGWLNEVFGVAQLNQTIFASGWLDEAWWARYAAESYFAEDYAANDNAHKVAHA